jgi:hypothetical protein
MHRLPSTRPFGQAPVQELRELTGACTGYVVLFLTDRGVWRVLLDERGLVLRLTTSIGAQRTVTQLRAVVAEDVVLVAGFSLADGRLVP